MVFESVRGYVQLASGLSELTRARATEAAHGLLSLQGAGIETGGKLAVQVSALAEELLAAATANRHNLTTLVRSEVDAAVNRIGLVPAEQLAESQAELVRLRAELAALRSGSGGSTTKRAAAKKTAKKTPKKTAAKKATTKKTATKPAVKKAAAKKATTKKAAVKKTAATNTATNTATETPSSTGPLRPSATGPSAATSSPNPAGA